MANKSGKALVYTEKEKCRLCYTCVRECPAKAIRVNQGQAEIIESRCIGCGNCVVVCSQNAKKYRNSVEPVKRLLASHHRRIAIVAPSFPAEFDKINDAGDYRDFVGKVRALGFDQVCEVAFGADLIALKTKEILEDKDQDVHITSSCPAIVSYIEKYHSGVTNKISKLVSPMIAMGKVVKKMYGFKSKVVFIGPCIAKKDEIEIKELEGIVDYVLTFKELKELFEEFNLNDKDITPTPFDPPVGGKGAIFPLSGGVLQSFNQFEDLTYGNVVVAKGKKLFPEALKEFCSGELQDKHLDLLCCNGCTMGAGMSKGGKEFVRRIIVSRYVQNKLKHFDEEEWKKYIEEFSSLKLERSYTEDDQSLLTIDSEEDEKKLKEIFRQMNKLKPEDELNCSACGYDSCRDYALAILKGLAEPEMCLPYTINKLHNYITQLREIHKKLVNAKEALRQSEKLASMGQLSAGIAHEVNNPLGVVLMYAHLLMDETDPDSEIYSDLQMIASQADRCKNILSGLLNFARKNEVKFKETDIVDLVGKTLGDVVVPKNVNIKVKHKSTDTKTYLDIDQMRQVLSNLVKNAIEAMKNKGEIIITTDSTSKEVSFIIEDNGPGIPKGNIAKLFEPFFTTKGIGKGTGLGLAVCYGIIKMHKGDIKVESNSSEDAGATGTKFIITIPRKRMKD